MTRKPKEPGVEIRLVVSRVDAKLLQKLVEGKKVPSIKALFYTWMEEKFMASFSV